MDPKAKPLPWGAVSTERENQLLPQPRETVLKGISNNSRIKQTGPKPAPPVQRTLASSRLKIDFRPIVEPVTLAGRLRLFLPNWQQITVDPAILDVVRGYKLEFLAPPSQERTRPPPPPAVFARGVGENRLRGCYPPRERRFEYGQAGFRPVFKQLVFGAQTGREISPSNKSKGTECISEVRAFQNGRHSSSSRSASASDWLGKIDLKDAYFVIPIWKDRRKYLRFFWKSSLLEFACLPFGLTVAPRLFTKVLKPVVALLRQAGIRLIIYLDDLLFMSQSKEGLGLDMATARYLLKNLGFVINLKSLASFQHRPWSFSVL